MATATVDVGFPVGTNMDLFDIGLLATGTVSQQTASGYHVNLGDELLAFTGTGFTFNPAGDAVTGAGVCGAGVFAIESCGATGSVARR